jgi:hypothetical protein
MSCAAAPIAYVSCVLACTCTLLFGCAAPGDPSARHPVIPVAITDLTTRQSGAAAVLTFTLPHESTGGESLTEPPAIEIYRAPLSPNAAPDRKTPWRLVYTIPAQRAESYIKEDLIEFRDPLTSDELGQIAGSRLAYLVRTRASKTRSSNDSNVSVVHMYPEPPVPHDVRASVAKSAIELSWIDVPSPEAASPAGYRVYRAELEPGQEVAAQDLSQVKLRSAVELVGSSPSADFRDTHFEFGRTYLYTVRAIAQFGSDVVESASSAPVVVTPRNTFPPGAPVELDAVVIPATAQSAAYVELSWAINPEQDLAGYNVYRSSQEDTPGERINRETLPTPTFRDTSVVTGKHYFYCVSAVDRAGNQSPLSSAIQIKVSQNEQ